MVLRSQRQLPSSSPTTPTTTTTTTTTTTAADDEHSTAFDNSNISDRDVAEILDADTEDMDVDDEDFIDILPTTPGPLFVDFSQQKLPAAGDKKEKLVKQSNQNVWFRLSKVKIPLDWHEVVPSPSDLKDKLNELYNAQTILVDTYADVPTVLKTLGNMKLGFCLVSIRDPRKFDFSCLLAKNLVGSSKAACLVRMPSLLSLQRDDVLRNIMKVAFL